MSDIFQINPGSSHNHIQSVSLGGTSCVTILSDVPVNQELPEYDTLFDADLYLCAGVCIMPDDPPYSEDDLIGGAVSDLCDYQLIDLNGDYIVDLNGAYICGIPPE